MHGWAITVAVINSFKFLRMGIHIMLVGSMKNIYLLLLISMLWHRQAIFESKGDNLSSSAECRIRTQRVSETQSSADWMPADKPTELSRIKQNLNSTARPYDQQAFSPPDPTAIWHSHLINSFKFCAWEHISCWWEAWKIYTYVYVYVILKRVFV